MKPNFAPVLIITLCRYTHFKRCIESLAQNTHAEKTIVYIALDYPAKHGHWDGYNKILNYLPNIKGFKDIIVLKRDKNYGAYKNFIDAMDLVFSQYDRYIFSEDDNEFSPNFLDYMNQTLEYYKDDDNVMAICGYRHFANYPDMEESCIKLSRFTAWGIGLWKDKYQSCRNELTYKAIIDTLIDLRQVVKIAKKRLYILYILLVMSIDKKVNFDTMITRNILLNNKRCIFPTVSKVRNHGLDGSGTDKKPANNMVLYESQIIDTNASFLLKENIDATMQEKWNKELDIFYKKSFKQSVKIKYWTFTRYIYFRIQYFLNKQSFRNNI